MYSSRFVGLMHYVLLNVTGFYTLRQMAKKVEHQHTLRQSNCAELKHENYKEMKRERQSLDAG